MSSKYPLEQKHGRQTDMHFDDAEGTFVFNTKEDATLLLDKNKRKFNDYGDKTLQREAWGMASCSLYSRNYLGKMDGRN